MGVFWSDWTIKPWLTTGRQTKKSYKLRLYVQHCEMLYGKSWGKAKLGEGNSFVDKSTKHSHLHCTSTTKMLPRDAFWEPKMCLKCVCNRSSAPEPAGERTALFQTEERGWKRKERELREKKGGWWDLGKVISWRWWGWTPVDSRAVIGNTPAISNSFNRCTDKYHSQLARR